MLLFFGYLCFIFAILIIIGTDGHPSTSNDRWGLLLLSIVGIICFTVNNKIKERERQEKVQAYMELLNCSATQAEHYVNLNIPISIQSNRPQ